MHQVRDAGDATSGDGERLDRVGSRLGGRRNGDRAGVGDVVEKPDGDASLGGGEEGREHEGACVGLEADVVDGDVESALGLAHEGREPPRDVRRALAALAERRHLDRPGRAGDDLGHAVEAGAAARSSALCARFFAW